MMHDDKPSKKQPISPQTPVTELRSRRTFPLYLAAGFSAIAFAVGSGLAWWTNTPSPKPSVSANSLQPIKPNQFTAPAPTKAPTEKSVQIYWLKAVGNEIELAAAPIALNEAQPNVVLKAAFEKMLQGSTDPTLTSTIPANTKLQELKIQPDGVHVDLSSEFMTGGGSTAMMGRVAQVIYTATTLDPDAPVWISIDDEPLEVLGGEGLVIDQPMTRQEFDQNFSL
ncbi:MAG: GerMN domain-containing protein [Timaviella obliquedivisa GSE-PSE-MK23-08B]|jgi:spore germination protein GerM|nr:GerMN domain-containing protein [Timaviella obliquedivisa GSE-PSE-MK23-08B]